LPVKRITRDSETEFMQDKDTAKIKQEEVRKI